MATVTHPKELFQALHLPPAPERQSPPQARDGRRGAAPRRHIGRRALIHRQRTVATSTDTRCGTNSQNDDCRSHNSLMPYLNFELRADPLRRDVINGTDLYRHASADRFEAFTP